LITSVQSTRECRGNLDLRGLIELAADGLGQMFDSEKGVFCFRLNQTNDALVREGTSVRYTIISLLGLHRLEASGGRSPISVHTTLEKLLGEDNQITNAGDFGLLLWLCALVSPKSLGPVCRKLDLQNALRRYSDARQRRTMELAWLLAGFSHSTLAGAADGKFSDIAFEAYRLIKSNQGKSGLFGHLHKSASFSGMIRGRIGSFADQVYPIYALSKFAQAYDVPEALELALKCAEGISRAQGPLGQWWWHYDSHSGEVRGHYPVYSVHQHGMGPMALLAISEASGADFNASICKGLKWISGNNEIGFDFRSLEAKVVWRSLYSSTHGTTLDVVKSFLRKPERSHSTHNLTVKFECWPYELGWLLYALAGTDPSDLGLG
jgi:hypothetical protein